MTATITAPNQITIETAQKRPSRAKKQKPIKLDDPKLKLASPTDIQLEQLEFRLQQAERFAIRGYSVALHELAESKGQTVHSVAESPSALVEAGLPTQLDPSIVREAHKINRNAIDGMLFRSNAMPVVGRPANTPAPQLSKEQAEQAIVDAAKQLPSATIKVSGPDRVQALAQQIIAAGPGAAVVQPKPASMQPKKGIFGFATCRVVFWMARNGGLTSAQAIKACATLNAGVKDSTISGWYKMVAANEPNSVEVAALSAEQQAQILAAAI